MTYSLTVLADVPKAYLRLNDGTGTLPNGMNFVDSSGNSFTGQALATSGNTTRNASLINDTSGASVKFTNSGAAFGWIIAKAGSVIPGSSTISVEGWFNPNNVVPTTNRWVFAFAGHTIFWTPSKTIELSFTDSLSGLTTIQSGVLDPTKTYHVVTVNDGTTIYLYINGALAASTPAGSSIAGNFTYSVGKNANTGAGGFYQEFAIYEYPLNSTQVLSHYNKGIAG